MARMKYRVCEGIFNDDGYLLNLKIVYECTTALESMKTYFLQHYSPECYLFASMIDTLAPKFYVYDIQCKKWRSSGGAGLLCINGKKATK